MSNEDVELDLSKVIADSLSSILPPTAFPSGHEDAPGNTEAGEPPGSGQHSESEEDGGELDLEGAIGKAFELINFISDPSSHIPTEINTELASEIHPETHTEIPIEANITQDIRRVDQSADVKASDNVESHFESSINEFTHDNDDEELNKAIGDVFSSMGHTDSSNQQNGHDEQNLDSAISNALQSIMGGELATTSEKDTHPETQNAQVLTSTAPHTGITTENMDQDEDTQLEDAISNVFESFLANDGLQQQQHGHQDIQSQHQKPQEYLQLGEITKQSFDRHDEEDADLRNEISKAFKETQAPDQSSAEEQPHTNSNMTQSEVDVTNDQPDIDLERAIGAAFESTFASEEKKEDLSHFQEEMPDTHHPEENENDYENPDADLALDKAIGDAFSNIFHQQSEESQSTDSQQKNTALEISLSADDDNHEMDLEEAIGSTFKSLLGNDLNTNETNHSSDAAHNDSGNDPVQENEIEQALESVISQAFRNTLGLRTSSIVNSSSLQDSTSNVTGSQHALSNLVPTLAKRLSIAIANHEVPSLDIASIVQNVVHQMSTVSDLILAASSDSFPISKDLLDELALEITSKVQDYDDKISHANQKQITEMPQIDDNVLAHFQEEAYKDERNEQEQILKENLLKQKQLQQQIQQAELQSRRLQEEKSVASSRISYLGKTVASGMRLNSTTSQLQGNISSVESLQAMNRGEPQDLQHSVLLPLRGGLDNEAADLETLQMNDIMERALNMAMENPQALLTNVDMDYELMKSVTPERQQVPASTTQDSTTIRGNQPHSDIPVASRAKETPKQSRKKTIGSQTVGDGNDELSLGLNKQKSTTKSSLALANEAPTSLDVVSMPLKNPMSQDLSTLNNSESTSQSESLDIGSNSKEGGKDLSIAEALALHRSNMANKNLNTSVGPKKATQSPLSGQEWNSNLSSVLSSISQRIRTNGSDSHGLLQVIRQMTNSLSASHLNFATGKLIANEIINSHRTRELHKKLVDSLLVARTFLERRRNILTNASAVSLINSVLQSFKASEDESTDLAKHDESKAPSIDTDTISSLIDTVVGAISNYTTKQARNRIKQPKDTLEYKEKIRQGNRERKKKWREENAERNKDNDLRARVTKRANVLFRDGSESKKKEWIENEFNTRRLKRFEREREIQSRDSKGFSGDSMLEADPALTELVSDIFNIVSGLTTKEDPKSALAATSAATASVAAIYALDTGSDLKVINNAVLMIVTGLIEKSNSRQQKPLSYNRIGIGMPFTTGLSTSRVFSGTEAIGTSSAVSDSDKNIDNLGRLSLSDGKRKLDDEGGDPTPKRQRSVSPNGRRTAQTTSISELDRIKASYAQNLWGKTSLKMPQYKKPDTTGGNFLADVKGKADPSYKLEPKRGLAYSLSNLSPFISHKVPFTDSERPGASAPKPTSGLRKPGSFQRPGYAKPDKSKTKSVGLSTMIS